MTSRERVRVVEHAFASERVERTTTGDVVEARASIVGARVQSAFSVASRFIVANFIVIISLPFERSSTHETSRVD